MTGPSLEKKWIKKVGSSKIWHKSNWMGWHRLKVEREIWTFIGYIKIVSKLCGAWSKKHKIMGWVSYQIAVVCIDNFDVATQSLWSVDLVASIFVIFCICGQSRLIFGGHKSLLVGALMKCLQRAMHGPVLKYLTVAHLVKKSVGTNGTRRSGGVSHRRPLSWTSLRHSAPFPVTSGPVVFPLSVPGADMLYFFLDFLWFVYVIPCPLRLLRIQPSSSLIWSP
jgi:hypothetical protein